MWKWMLRFSAEHPGDERRMRGQKKPQRKRKAQHPLPDRPLGQHLVDQPGRAVGHPARTATGTEAAALAAEREQMLGVAGIAAKAQEPMIQPAALQVAVERLPNVARQLFTGLGQVFDEGFQALFYSPMVIIQLLMILVLAAQLLELLVRITLYRRGT